MSYLTWRHVDVGQWGIDVVGLDVMFPECSPRAPQSHWLGKAITLGHVCFLGDEHLRTILFDRIDSEVKLSEISKPENII